MLAVSQIREWKIDKKPPDESLTHPENSDAGTGRACLLKKTSP